MSPTNVKSADILLTGELRLPETLEHDIIPSLLEGLGINVNNMSSNESDKAQQTNIHEGLKLLAGVLNGQGTRPSDLKKAEKALTASVAIWCGNDEVMASHFVDHAILEIQEMLEPAAERSIG